MLGRCTSPEASGRPTLLVPIGSCEQHGPHLPLATDTLVADTIAHTAAGRTTGSMVTPPLAITASGEHAGFAGTLSIGTDAMAHVIVELVRSADWADGVVLVNGHGGNRDAVERAVTTLSQDGRAVLAWWPIVRGGDAHAGRTETSMMLAIDPGAVRVDLAERGATDPLETIERRLRHGGMRSVSPNGVLGDPAGATVEEGRRILDELVADLVAAVETWRRR